MKGLKKPYEWSDAIKKYYVNYSSFQVVSSLGTQLWSASHKFINLHLCHLQSIEQVACRINAIPHHEMSKLSRPCSKYETFAKTGYYKH